jgi:hypothetical protein
MKPKNQIEQDEPGKWNQEKVNDDIYLVVGNFKNLGKANQIIRHVVENSLVKSKRLPGWAIFALQTSRYNK